MDIKLEGEGIRIFDADWAVVISDKYVISELKRIATKILEE